MTVSTRAGQIGLDVGYFGYWDGSQRMGRERQHCKGLMFK